MRRAVVLACLAVLVASGCAFGPGKIPSTVRYVGPTKIPVR